MRFLRTIGLGMFALALCFATPGTAQQSTAEGLSEEALNKLNDAQSIAQQLAQQQGQFAGRSIGPQFASATNQLLQVLTNFDIWACGVSVTALQRRAGQSRCCRNCATAMSTGSTAIRRVEAAPAPPAGRRTSRRRSPSLSRR